MQRAPYVKYFIKADYISESTTVIESDFKASAYTSPSPAPAGMVIAIF